jgi:NAD(P)-dependent dehydrogenase (short-subunit alcohol dehydrogenase family)
MRRRELSLHQQSVLSVLPGRLTKSLKDRRRLQQRLSKKCRRSSRARRLWSRGARPASGAQRLFFSSEWAVGDRQKPAASDGLLYAPCDVAEVADLEGLLHGAVDKMGHVDLWVNNAGLEIETSWKPFGKKAMDPANRAKLVNLINVNMLAMIDGTRIAVHYMKEAGRGGTVLNVASLAAFVPMPQAPVYSATKVCVSGLEQRLPQPSPSSIYVHINLLAECAQ